jgi:hypothetical protein
MTSLTREHLRSRLRRIVVSRLQTGNKRRRGATAAAAAAETAAAETAAAETADTNAANAATNVAATASIDYGASTAQ